MNTQTVHIYVCHHKEGFVVQDEVFKPIHVGSVLSSRMLNMASDDGEDSISQKNREYCELTAMYWAWKHDKAADWIGLMHYRRYLAFKDPRLSPDVFGCLNFDELDHESATSTGLNAATVKNIIESHTDLKAIMPTKWAVSKIGLRSLAEHYETADFHHAKDLQTTRQVLAEKYPQHLETFDRVMANDSGYFTNVFVLKREIFAAYCEWLFDILFEVEERTDLNNYSIAGRRVYGYLAERLFNVYMSTLNLRPDECLELSRTFFRKTETQVEPAALEPPPENGMTLVIASDNNFVPHLAALIESIKDTVPTQRSLQICVLDGGISPKNRALLHKQFRQGLAQRGSLYFQDCSHLYNNVDVHMHFSASTFYRIDLGKILPKHRRAIYIDCDTIVQGDLSQLWDLDLGSKAIAAAPDLIMKNFVRHKTPAMKEAGGQPAGEYLRDHVQMGTAIDDYFQAGVIVFDLDRYRELDISEKALSELKSKKHWFLDQDILNRFLVGHVKFLDTSWNCVNMVMDILPGLNAEWAAKAKEDFAKPNIIHYAGFEAKPWNNHKAPWSEIYWFYLRKTYWYESVALKFPSTSDAGKLIDKGPVYLTLRSIWRALPNPVKVSLGAAMHRFNRWYFKL